MSGNSREKSLVITKAEQRRADRILAKVREHERSGDPRRIVGIKFDDETLVFEFPADTYGYH